ncbi:MAG: allophanate hydrolase subunit 1 [Rubellimicrobium sp.]|nr:allophanate hydrolase subunit 1 [Rubellimicrobium sp.]
MRVLSVRPLADNAVTLELASGPGDEAARLVAAATGAIAAAIARGDLPGAEEVAGAFCSVTVPYDCLVVRQEDLVTRLMGILAGVGPVTDKGGRLWHLPCAYEDGIDLPDLAAHFGLTEGAIVRRHAATVFRVDTLGFLPGLPFLGGLPADLARPRRSEPRLAVPGGAVAIANRMCVIYPWVSPGGWHIVGSCPVPLFDIARDPPALLAPGDRVQFHAVTQAEARAIAAAPPDPRRWLAEGG